MTSKLVWMNYVGIDLAETIFFINIIAQLETDRDLKLVSYSTKGNSSQIKRISRSSLLRIQKFPEVLGQNSFRKLRGIRVESALSIRAAAGNGSI